MSRRPRSELRCLAAAVVLTLPLAGFAPPPTALPGGLVIVYKTENGPFCGRCDGWKLTVASNGKVWIEHSYRDTAYDTWDTTRRRIRVSPERFAAFRESLDQYRPKGALDLSDNADCKEFWTDMAGVKVTWREGGAEDRLHYNYGCDPSTREAMSKALRGAPAMLGVKTDD